MLVDTHAHLNMKEFDGDRDAVVHRASEAGVDLILDIGTDLESSQKAVGLSEKHQSIYASLGVHPHEAAKTKDFDWIELEKLLSHPKAKAVGEMGLDYHYHFSPEAVQKDIFSRQLILARTLNKPVVVHVREAMQDALEVIQRAGPPPWKGVFHCFGGREDDIPKVLDLGFHISFTGVLTFKNYSSFELLKRVPLNRLLVETDSPYMAPVPCRGKRNEPAWIVHTVRRVSEILNVPYEEVCSQTTRNAVRLFGLEM